MQSPATLRNAVKTLNNRIERHAAAIILNMLISKTRGLVFAQRVRQRALGTLWQQMGSSRTTWARC